MTASTAIKRKAPPVPLRWLHEQGRIISGDLDYGCGHGPWYDMDGWDPGHHVSALDVPYNTITCCYVLNTVDKEMEKIIIHGVKYMLSAGGTAYFIVRRDLPKEGRQGRGCWQRYVELDMPILRETSTYCIYQYRKDKP